MSPRIIRPEGDWINQVLGIFAEDSPVALPTETVYGLAAPLSRGRAILRVYEIKERPRFNPLIVHVLETWDLSKWLRLEPENSRIENELIRRFWPGPLSLLLPKQKSVPDLVTAGSDFVVIRSPRHPVIRELLEALGEPLVAPSANRSSRLSPTTAEAVVESLGDRLSAVVDGGPCVHGLESTIVRVQNGKIQILREGAITHEDLNDFHFEEGDYEQTVPGSQTKHYAPLAKLVFCKSSDEWIQGAKTRTLWLKVLESDAPSGIVSGNVLCLSPENDLALAAQKLFEVLREVQHHYDELRVLCTVEVGLGRAINDRLRRASG